jgi:hypothetical protein
MVENYGQRSLREIRIRFLGADSEYLLACLSSTTTSFGYFACIATPAIQNTSYAQALDLIALIMRAV